ncbi:carbohydrate ABC transporter substrate-binding protein, CUT1 family [Clostridium sp. USBA 49]|jgi:putative aldouronate transport system substrate-binding protein|uniref:ABC transporter substrate-binding protein n=1 Tax=Clostridium TaxID=1485 RepID=UPI00099A16B9|nr:MULTISPECIES: ABC transporter substrate-binding protein [Clostridium]SKA74187.1 carbohydrate ABC transporter substrate-binding protein, CUT1 family [Clostridium sp. USBA 49]
MKGKRIISLVVGAMLSTGILAGCQKSEPTQGAGNNTDSVKGDPITFTFFNGFGNATQFPDDNDFTNWVKEQTGVTIKVEYLAGDLNTKVGVMLASGDYPDFIYGWDAHQKFVDAGAAVPLNDYIEKYGTNIKKYQEPILKKSTQKDGKIYFIPPYREGVNNATASGGFYVQKRVLEEAGYPKITTLDQYFNILEDYKSKHPTTDGSSTIGFSVISDPTAFFTITNPGGALAGYSNDGILQFDPKTITGKLYANNDSSKKYWTKLNEEWNKGMIDPEAFTQKIDQYMSKLATGRVLGFFDYGWRLSNVQNSLHQQGKDEYQYVAFPVVWDNSIVDRYQLPSTPITRDGISISTSCKDPVRAFKFIDWLMSEEVQKRINWGVKDKDYNVDSNGKMYRTPEQREQLKNQDYIKKTGIGMFGYPWPVNSINAKYSDGNYWMPSGDPDEIAANYTDSDKKVLEKYGVKTWGEMFHPDKGNPWGEAWDVKLPDGSNEQLTNTKINELMQEYVPKMIMAKSSSEFESLWNKYTSEINKLDVKGLEQFITNAIQERVKQWGTGESK